MERHKRLWTAIVLFGVALCGGILMLVIYNGLTLVLGLYDPSIPDPRAIIFDILRTLLSGLPRVGGQVSEAADQSEISGVSVWAEANPNKFFFLLGSLLALTTRWPYAARLYRRHFIRFDRRVLSRIYPPQAFDPGRPADDDFDERVMPWQPPQDGRRAEAWNRLLAFAQPDGERFSWTLLLGRPGAGKTRMAMELARERGKIDKFRAQSPKASISDQLKTWWRVQLRGLPPGPDDYWDVAWFRAGKFVEAGPQDRLAADVGIGPLQNWRPRRPTLIIFDDPTEGDTNKVVQALLGSRAEFRHDVRLLVVNQSAPIDMKIQRAGSYGDWRSGVMPFGVAPVIAPSLRAFTQIDIQRLRFSMLGKHAPKLKTDTDIRDFLRLTRGTPLLVELGFSWLRQNKPLETMSRHGLLAHRVERINDALETAGFDATMQFCLATATLAAGGADWRYGEDEGQGTPIDMLQSAFEARLRDPKGLARIFPADTVDLLEVIPPVRPALIGFAFVRHVLNTSSVAIARKIVETAWRASPSGTLRAALLLDREPRLGDPGRLEALLSERPPEGIAPLPDLFAAYAEVACLVPREDWEDGAYFIGYGLEGTALDIADQMEAGDLRAALDLALQFAATPNGVAHRRQPALNLLISGLIERGLRDNAFEKISDLVRALETWWQASSTYGGPQTFDGEAADWDDLATLEMDVSGDRLKLCLKSLTNLFSDKRVRAYCVALLVRVLERSVPDEDPWAAAGHIIARSLLDDEEGTQKLLDQFEKTWPDGDLEKEESALPRSIAFRYSAYAQTGNPAACQKLAERVDAIAAPFAGDRDFELQRAVAWRHVSYAQESDPVACRSAAEHVDAIAARFAGDSDFELERARAWRSVAFSQDGDPAACRAQAEWVDAIAAPFAGDLDFELERSQAWRSVAYSQRIDPAACRTLAERVEAIAVPFSGDRDFELQRAAAWRFAAYSQTNDPSACRTLAERVEALAVPFSGDRDFERERAAAWRFVVFSSTSDSGACRKLAQRVDAIAASFPEDRDFEFQRAEAWRSVTYSQRNDPAACRTLAEQVDEITVPFAGDRDFEDQRAQAWRFVVHAHRNDPAACRTLAEKVDAIAAEFAGDRDFEYQRALAWRIVSHAHRNDPVACRTLAEKVDAIAAEFAGDRDFAIERARAWRWAAGAHRTDPAAYQSIIDTIQAIAHAFPGDTEIQDTLRDAKLAGPSKSGGD
ncbi:MAG: hypothetical protein AAF583_11650 [Pseudomonadota bacterium]